MEGQQRKARRRLRAVTFKRAIKIGKNWSDLSLEPPFWDTLTEIATARGIAIGELASAIDRDRANANLSSAIRVFVVTHYRILAKRKG